MALLYLSLALLALSFIPNISCFTNGTLLPSYMCGPANDGMPKSLGGVLPYFKLATNPQLTPQAMDGMMKAHDRALDAGNGGTVMNTMQVLAGFHSAALPDPPPTTPFKKVVNIAVTKVVGVDGVTNKVFSGLDHHLQIQSTPGDLGVFDDNVALDGCLIYAQDSKGNRVGQFKELGDNMKLFPGCNIHGDNPQAGAVHFQLLSCNGHYDGLVWTAPINMVGQTVEFKGAAVTDAGYGAHSTIYTIEAPPVMAPQVPTIMSLVYSMASSMLFFADNGNAAANDLAANFLVTVTDTVTKKTLGTMNAKASPLMFNLQNLVVQGGANGNPVQITVSAVNGKGTSTNSAPITVTGGKFMAGVL